MEAASPVTRDAIRLCRRPFDDEYRRESGAMPAHDSLASDDNQSLLPLRPHPSVTTQNSRFIEVKRGFGLCRFKAESYWRRARFTEVRVLPDLSFSKKT